MRECQLRSGCTIVSYERVSVQFCFSGAVALDLLLGDVWGSDGDAEGNGVVVTKDLLLVVKNPILAGGCGRKLVRRRGPCNVFVGRYRGH